MDILDPATDTNAKRLYSYVKSQKKDSSSVGYLRSPDGQTYSSPGRKANILNDQFASVFTVEDEDDMPELEPALYEAMPEIYIHVNEVAKLLRGIKAHKATGPDAIPARLLKEAADRGDKHNSRMDLVVPRRSRTDSCLGRNVIRLHASHTRSAAVYCPWPATVSDIYQ